MTISIETAVIRWERPPDPVKKARRGAGRPWAAVAYQLRQRPGQWALIDEDANSRAPGVAHRINNAAVSWFAPAGSFLAVQRTVGGSVCIYAVYLGEDHEYAEVAGVVCRDCH